MGEVWGSMAELVQRSASAAEHQSRLSSDALGVYHPKLRSRELESDRAQEWWRTSENYKTFLALQWLNLIAVIVAIPLIWLVTGATLWAIVIGAAIFGLLLHPVIVLVERRAIRGVFKLHDDIVRELEHETRTRRENAMLVRAIGHAASTQSDEVAYLEHVGAAMEDHLSFERGAIALYDKSGGLGSVVTFGKDCVVAEGHGGDYLERLAAEVRKREEPLLCVRDGRRSGELNRFFEGLTEAELAEVLCVPIQDSDKTIGVIVVSTSSGSVERLTSVEVNTLTGVASQIAAGLGSVWALRRLRESEQQYRGVVESAASLILRLDQWGQIVFSNKFALRILGEEASEIVGAKLADVILGSDDDDVSRKSFSKTIESELISADGRRHWVAWTIKPIIGQRDDVIGVLCIGNDLTELRQSELERRELEKQLIFAQKLEALGTLAGGVAHDFNNLLMGIQGCTSILADELGEQEHQRELVTEVDEYVRRASELTSQLLAFGRGGRYEVNPIDMNEVVNKTIAMFSRMKKEISVELELGEGLWSVEADSRQLEQVVLNLCINAAQAMPGGGLLQVVTANIEADARPHRDFTIPAGRYVRLSVLDAGVGMDEETQRRIFEPFFSTKELGRGTGLGLASVYGIVKNHGGYILVESELERGSTFHIELPASELPAVNAPVVERHTLQGSGTILLVDDEPMILRAGERLLKKLGYSVLSARSGAEAVTLFEERNDVDVVLLDMIMPGMSGVETFRKLRDLDPDVKVLLSSGYSAESQARELFESGCEAFIQKPYDVAALSSKLREVMESVDT